MSEASRGIGRRLLQTDGTQGWLDLEAELGLRQSFVDFDSAIDQVMCVAVRGRRDVMFIERGYKHEYFSVGYLSHGERTAVRAQLDPRAQESRGNWSLPDAVTFRADLLRFRVPHTHLRIKLAHTEEESKAFVVCLWLLQDLVRQVKLPTMLRASKRGRPAGLKTMAQQRQFWPELEQLYEDLGIPTKLLEPFRPGGGWSGLDRDQKAEADAALRRGWFTPSKAMATRFRAIQLRELIERYYQKAGRTPPTKKQVMNQQLELTLALWFGGGWMEFLDYIGEEPSPVEDLTRELPVGDLLGNPVGHRAATPGIDEGERDRILAAYWGENRGDTAPQRAQALKAFWSAAEELYLRLNVDDEGESGRLGSLLHRGTRNWTPWEQGPFNLNQLFESPSDQHLWQTRPPEALPGRLISEPNPSEAAIELLGDAWTAWEIHLSDIQTRFSSHTARFEDFLNRDQLPPGRKVFRFDFRVGGLEAAGVAPDADQLRAELLQVAKEHGGYNHHEESWLAVQREISADAFRPMLETAVKQRRKWAEKHLNSWIEYRWQELVGGAAENYVRLALRRGKPPSESQLLKLASDAARLWFAGQLDGVCAAATLPSPGRFEYQRLLPEDLEGFKADVYQRLGGSSEYDGFDPMSWAPIRLADKSVKAVQAAEQAGAFPDAPTWFAEPGVFINSDPDVAWARYQGVLVDTLRAHGMNPPGIAVAAT